MPPAPGATTTSSSLPSASSQAPSPGALAALASQPLVFLPSQVLRLGVADWSAKVGDQRAYLANLDDEIAFAIRERGLRAKWAFPPDLARVAKRNPTYVNDPYAIAIEGLAPVERDAEKLVGEPLAGQLRALAAKFNARYAVVPVGVRIAPEGAGGRATLHLVVVDVRMARLTWKGDIAADPLPSFSPAVAAGLAGRVADLFFTPR
jgi:hypothetical protein